ncbi:sigma-70 family RNA polymerase sigma factor [Streptomyces barkulensis]|uniref:sigma-70 family RNA polymerase sigma factor n=1 Tax=Streptomyces barkulensis TaxID=1257026 RepID=UPI000C6E0F79|nr:sigma-70 family RNA polymerase sigma factor [Streptomyces barkulensis]
MDTQSACQCLPLTIPGTGPARRPTPIDLHAFDTAELRGTCDPIGQLEENLHLFGAIAALSERQQDVIMLRYCLGYSAAETATHLGITDAGVRSIARQARRRLEQLLDLEGKGNADDTAQ